MLAGTLVGLGGERRVVERRRAAAGARRPTPARYGLDWSARAVNGAGPPPDPIVRRPGDAHRRLFLIDLASGARAEVGPPELSVWEVDWDGDGTGRRDRRPRDHSGSGWYGATSPGWTSARAPPDALRAGVADRRAGALAGRLDAPSMVEGYASDHGLLAGSLMLIDLGDGRDDRSVARPGDRRARRRGATTNRSGTRAPTGPGTRAAGSGWTGGARSGGAAPRSSATR